MPHLRPVEILRALRPVERLRALLPWWWLSMLRALLPWWLSILLLTLALALIVQLIDFTDRKWLEFVIIPLVLNICATLLAFLVGYEAVAKRMATLRDERELGALRRFWANADPSRGFVIVSAGNIPSDIDGKPTDLSLDTLLSWGALRDCLHRIFGKSVSIEYRQASSIPDWKHLRAKNVIFLGGYKKLKGFEGVSNMLTVRQDFQEIRQQGLKDFRPRRVVKVGATEYVSEYVSDVDGDHLYTDYGVVTRFHTDAGHIVVWFSGNFGVATYASVLFSTQEPHLQRATVTYPGRRKILQIVVEVTGIQNNWIAERHNEISKVDTRVHDDQSRMIENAIFMMSNGS